MTHQAGNTYSTERICARGGVPGDTAHGQILALFTVAAAFRATRRRHNLGRGEDRSPHKSGARWWEGPGSSQPPPAQPRGGQDTGASGQLATMGLPALQNAPGLRRVLEWPSEAVRSKRRVIYRKEEEEQSERQRRGLGPQRNQRLMRSREEKVGEAEERNRARKSQGPDLERNQQRWVCGG